MPVSASELARLDRTFEGERLIRKRRDLVVDGFEYKTLCFVRDGYAMRYKLLRNGKRQILNVILPGDVVGLPVSFFDRSIYSVIALSDLRFDVCSIESYVQLCLDQPQFGLALSWLAVQEAAIYAEHIVDIGRRTPIERLAHFILEIHSSLEAVGRAERTRSHLPFSQEVIAAVLGLSVPHVNRVIQQLRIDGLIETRARAIELLDVPALHALAHYPPMVLAQIPMPT